MYISMWIFSKFRDAVMCMHRCDLRVHVCTNILYDTCLLVFLASQRAILGPFWYLIIIIERSCYLGDIIFFKEARGVWNSWPRDKESHSLCIELARHPMWSYNPWIGYPSLSLEVIIQVWKWHPEKVKSGGGCGTGEWGGNTSFSASPITVPSVR